MASGSYNGDGARPTHLAGLHKLQHGWIAVKTVKKSISLTIKSCIAKSGRAYILHEGKTIAIEPGQIHFARAAGEPVWIEVESVPPWSADNHFVL